MSTCSYRTTTADWCPRSSPCHGRPETRGFCGRLSGSAECWSVLSQLGRKKWSTWQSWVYSGVSSRTPSHIIVPDAAQKLRASRLALATCQGESIMLDIIFSLLTSFPSFQRYLPFSSLYSCDISPTDENQRYRRRLLCGIVASW